MFDAIGPWGWVAIAWGEVVVACLGYYLYLGRRRRRLTDELREAPR